MKRRTFILGCALGIAAISIPASKWLGLYGGWDNGLAHPKLLSHLFNRQAIRALGKTYLKLKPHESNCDMLISELLGGPHSVLESQKLDIPGLQAHIEERIHLDFVNGKTIVLKGWILSVTEARQCAYFSMLNS